MKEVRGIKVFSISTIVAGSVVSLTLFSAWLQPGAFTSQRDINLMLASVLVSLLSLAYPAQLLLIRDKYYRHFPVSYSARVFVHIFRVIQLLFTLILTALLTMVAYNISRDMATAGNSYRFRGVQISICMLVLATVVLNLILFFKGWRLLKRVRRNYVDEVMSAFD